MPMSRDAGAKLSVGGENDLSAGPVANRRCTDFVFFILFLAHIAAFWVFSLWHAPHGDARQLYFPRDYKGQYCGLQKQWHEDQVDLEDFGHLIYTLDLSETIDPIAYEFLCSTEGVEAANLAGVRGSDYITLCSSVSSQPLAYFQSELANFRTYAGVSVTLSSGIEGSGNNVLADVDKYFNKVCVHSCDVSFESQSTDQEEDAVLGGSRNYLYMPAGDVAWYKVWKQIADNAPSSLEQFVFQALPVDQCPYEDPKYCVPLPGVTFAESSQGYCTFKVENTLLTSLTETTTEYLNQIASSSLAKELTGTVDLAFGAIATSWDTFVIVALLAFFAGLGFLVLLRFFVRPLVWVALIMVFVILVAGGTVAYIYSTECAATYSRPSSVSDTLDDPFLDDPCGGWYRIEDSVARQVLKYSAIVLWCLAMVYAIFAVCIIHHIKLAIAMNVVAAEFIYHTPHIFVVPIVQTIGAIAWTAIWMVMASLLLSQVPSDYVTVSCFTSYDSAHESCVETKAQAGFVWKDEGSEACVSSGCCWKCAPPRYTVDFRFFFSLFSFFWHHAFTVAVGQCIIAGAVGIWFFDKGARGSLTSSLVAVRTSTGRCLRFHLGSLAFGSLIAALIQTARLFTRDLAAQAHSQRNTFLEAIFTALSYCFLCFEKLVKFLGTGAYVQVALLGKPLCPSARNAILLLLGNMVRFRVLAALGAAIHLIGSLLMAGFTGLLGFLILESMHPETKMPVVLVSIYAALGFICGTLFMNVFRLAVDTTLQCFLATEEMNISKDFIPLKLQALVHVTARAEEEECGSTRPCLARYLRPRKSAAANLRKADGQETLASDVSCVTARPSEQEASEAPLPLAVSPKASSEASSPESPEMVAV